MTMLLRENGDFVDASPRKTVVRADKRTGYCILQGHVILYCEGNDEELIDWAETPQEAERLVEKIRMEAEKCQESVTKTCRKGSGKKSVADKNRLWQQINPGKKPPPKKTQRQQPIMAGKLKVKR